LYETLHTPKILQALVKNPHQAVLIPAFEVNMDACKESGDIECTPGYVPRNFDDLIVHLGEKSIFPMDPMDYELQGNTNYRGWVRQPRATLMDIDCVSSHNRFQPFLVVRKCQSLPPFQENMKMQHDEEESGNVHANDSTWIAHLIRLGYTLKQLGGEFVVYLPDSWTGRQDLFDQMLKTRGGLPGLSRGLRNHAQKTRDDFFAWLDRMIPDQRRLDICPEEDNTR
jgi:hypothetical protein